MARAVHRYAAETGATLVVSASMPIRDLEWYAGAQPRPPRVLANRGANGIDGVVSTALGVAASGRGPGVRTVALLGDLTFLHDVSGLVNLPDVPCTFVVLDNGGGGIFSFLPQAAALDAPVFEQLFGTPPTSDVGAVGARFRPARPRGDGAVPARAGVGRARHPRWSASGCPAGRRTSRCTMRSTRRSVSRCSDRRGRGRSRAPSRRAPEGQLHVGVARDLPSHLVDAAMMLVAQLDEIVEVGGAAVDPVPHVVDVGELGVRAAGEAASLVAASDLHPLGVTRICAGSVRD